MFLATNLSVHATRATVPPPTSLEPPYLAEPRFRQQVLPDLAQSARLSALEG